MSLVRFEKQADRYVITLDAPPLHILDIALLEELRAALREVRSDRHLLVTRTTGEKVFSAGASVQDHMGDRIGPMLSAFHDCFRILHRLDLVTVSFVRGAALGGGAELALAHDFVIASEKTRIGQPEINLGVFPPVAAWQLSRQLPPRVGMEMLLSGEPIAADRALELGLVNAVVSHDDFDGEAEGWLERITKQSASSLRHAKRAWRLAAADDFEERLANVEALYLDELMKTHDATEGLEAFIEKRPPRWEHR